jgi:hypothetical protein
VLKLQGLTVEDGSRLFVNGLADTQNGWSEVCDTLVVGFVDGLQERLSSTLTLLLFVEESTSNNFLTCLTLSKEGERSGVLFEKVLVDHGADLKWKIHKRKGNILQRLLGLGLGRALTLGLRGLCIQTSTMGRSCSFGCGIYLRWSSGVDWGSIMDGKDVRQSMSLNRGLLEIGVLRTRLLRSGVLSAVAATEHMTKGLEKKCRVDGRIRSSEVGKLSSIVCSLPTLVGGVDAGLSRLIQCGELSSVLDEQWIGVGVGV